MKEKVTPEQTKMIGEVTQSQIDQWKKTYGDRLFSIEKDGHIAYMRKPDRQIFSFLMTKSGTMEFNETLMQNCFIGGREVFKTDDDFFLAACMELNQLVEFGKVELKKI